MTAASLVLTAALVAWGSVVPEPPEPPDTAGQPSTEATPPPEPAEAAKTETLTPPVAAPAPAPVPIQPAIIAKAPIVVRATPAPAVAAPVRGKERGKLQSSWWFWAIAGGLLATTIAVTYVATRPGPQPYGGNTPPFVVTFP